MGFFKSKPAIVLREGQEHSVPLSKNVEFVIRRENGWIHMFERVRLQPSG